MVYIITTNSFEQMEIGPLVQLILHNLNIFYTITPNLLRHTFIYLPDNFWNQLCSIITLLYKQSDI